MDVGRAEMLAKELMTRWLSGDWTFRWSSAEAEFGSCWHAQKEIVLSRPLTALNDEEHVRVTVLHEIAHALAGRAAGHGPEWASWCRALGIVPERCYGDEVVTPPARWAGVCQVHGVVAERRELGKKFLARRSSCSKCSPAWSEEYVLEWVDRRSM